MRCIKSIWGFKNTEMCNKVHENAMRFYLGVHKFTPLPVSYGEMGWISVKYRYYLNTFGFWNRMMKLPNTSITRHVLQRYIDISMTKKTIGAVTLTNCYFDYPFMIT